MITNCDPAALSTSGLLLTTAQTHQQRVEAIVAEIDRLGTAAALTYPLREITGAGPTPSGLWPLAKSVSGNAFTTSSLLRHVSMYRAGKDVAGEERVIRFCIAEYGLNTLIGDYSMTGAELANQVTLSRDWGIMWSNIVGIDAQQAEDKITTYGHGSGSYRTRTMGCPYSNPDIAGTNTVGYQNAIGSNIRVYIWLDEDFLAIYCKSVASGYCFGANFIYELEPNANNGWSKGTLPRIYGMQAHPSNDPATSGEVHANAFGGAVTCGDRGNTGATAVIGFQYGYFYWRSSNFHLLTGDSSRKTIDGKIPVQQIHLVNNGWQNNNLAAPGPTSGLVGIIPHVRHIGTVAGTPTSDLSLFQIAAVDYHAVTVQWSTILAVPKGTYSATP